MTAIERASAWTLAWSVRRFKIDNFELLKAKLEERDDAQGRRLLIQFAAVNAIGGVVLGIAAAILSSLLPDPFGPVLFALCGVFLFGSATVAFAEAVSMIGLNRRDRAGEDTSAWRLRPAGIADWTWVLLIGSLVTAVQLT